MADPNTPAARTDQAVFGVFTVADVDFTEECPDCTCCTRARCFRGQDSDCRTSDGDYICPCTEE